MTHRRRTRWPLERTSGLRSMLSVLLALLIVCCAPLALAEEEILLPIDLAQLKETGFCLEGVPGGASFEEAVAAGLALDAETDKGYSAAQGSSRTLRLERHCVTLPDGLRTMSTALQFLDDHLACVDMYLQEEQDAQAMIDRFSEVFGEAAEVKLPTQDSKIGYAKWTFEANGVRVEWTATLALREEGARCQVLSVLYRDYVPESDA